jgi:protein NrfC
MRNEVSRRSFLRSSKNVAAGAVALPGILWLDDAVAAIPASLVDTKKCQGCATCMLACSLVHESKQGLYLMYPHGAKTPK